jgi:hypothetical protein
MNILGPYTNEELSTGLSEFTSVTVSAETSNTKSVKQIPVVVWFFQPMKAVNVIKRTLTQGGDT